jgi:histidinol-phosphate aminotransferase
MSVFNRRDFLRQGSLAAVGMGFLPSLMALVPDSEFRDHIKISSNENPYGPSPAAREAMVRSVSTCNRYPWAVTGILREAIAGYYGLGTGQVLVGAGSSELLGVVAAFAARQPGELLAAYPTFKLWFNAATHFGLQLHNVPLTAGKWHDLPAMEAAISDKTRLVYLVNPHNPTGTLLPEADLRATVSRIAARTLVLLDEAYIEYTGGTGLTDMLDAHPNLIIARTFSKIHGLAGARAGYILAHVDTIAALAGWQAWPNAGMSAVSLAGALASLEDHAFMDMVRRRNAEVRDTVSQELSGMGIPVIPSHTSFLYYDTSTLPRELATAATAADIQGVRTYEEGTAWRRTSIGTMSEMERFLDVVREVSGS